MLRPKKVKRNSAVKNPNNTNLNFVLNKIYPQTQNQERVFELYNEGKNELSLLLKRAVNV